ncbi:MAG: dihydroorotase [Acutalibacteraceae bacterium]|nr:dihydroorotase [Acutalibacteraceae bacterium]
MTHDFAYRYEKIRAFAEKFLADGGLSPVISKKYIIVPGLCDVHVHFREPGFPYKETIASGSAAAAHGGYTAVCTMPNLDPVPDSAEHLQVQLDAIERGAAIKVLPYGAITVGEKGEKLADMEAMSDKVCAFSDDGKGVQNDEMMREAMTAAKRLGKIIAAHCEDNSLLFGGYIHDGEYARMHGHRGISSASEYKQIERDLRLAEETDCAYHVCHISTKESVELIRQAKAHGVNVTCETAPHYLVLCDEDMQEDGRFKMNPPLRSREDKKALIEGIKDGTIDMIATDHAPHSAEEKGRGLEKSLMGVVGLETAFSVLYTELVMKNIITLDRLVELMSFKPKERFGIDTNNDFAVFDISEAYKIDPEDFLSMGRATPFAGREVFGRCLLTVHNGKVVYKAEDRA